MEVSIPPRVWFVKATGLLEGQIINYYLRKMDSDMETDMAFGCLTICLGMVLFIGVMVLMAYGLFEFVEVLAKS